MNKPVLAGLLLATSFGVNATTTLDNLVVTGSRTDTRSLRLASRVSVIDRDAIERSQAASLAELLASRAGIETLDYYGDGSRTSISLRGFGENAASNTLILIDGQPLNNPDIANPDLGRIRLEDIERIEILDGGSALWGNQAVGGVVHIVTRQTPGVGVSFSRGSFDSVDLRARAAAGNDTLHVSIGGSERRSDNYRDNNALTRSSASVSARLSGALAQAWLRMDHTEEQLQTPGGLFANEVAVDRRQSAPDFAGDYSALQTTNLAAGVRADLGHNWQFDARASRYDATGDFQLSFHGFASEPAAQERLVNSFNPQWTWRYTLSDQDGHLAFGADIQRADYLLDSQFGQQRNEQTLDDYYLSTLVPLHAQVDLNLTARHSRIEDRISDPGPFGVLPDGQAFRHSETLGSAGLTFRLNERLAVFGAWNQVLRYPKVDEYFGSGFTPASIGLRPQTGENTELGLRWSQPQLTASLVLYRLRLDDEIAYDPITFSNVNLDETTRDGASLTAHWAPHPRWSADLSWSLVDAEIRNADRIPLVAEQHGQLSLNYQSSAHWQLQAQVQASGNRLTGGDTDASQAPLPGYAVVNLATQWQHGPLRIGLKLLNVLDREYATVGFEDSFSDQVAFFPLPGAHGRLTLSYAL